MSAPMNAPTARKAIQDIYPLSPTQQGLLFHSLSDTQTGAYIVQVSYTLQGELNREAFSQAWQRLANRHSILRSAFVWKNIKAPVQVVGYRVQVPIHWHEWNEPEGDIRQQNSQQQLSALLKRDRAQGFDLSHAPLMRINAVQTGPNRYRIIWTHHHILLDGWSLPKLMREWIAYYQTECGRLLTAQLEAIIGESYSYRDYIAWLQKQDIAAAKQFWKVRLAGISAPTPLGIDTAKTEPLAGEDSTAEWRYTLSEELTKQLKAFAKQHRITLSTLVQGAWAKVLSVYSGNDDVLYGLACAGRPHTLENAEQRVGLFINTLPMRVKPKGELIACLQTIQVQQLEQQPYEYTPLIEIQAESDIHRRSSLFESIVVFENYPLESVSAVEGLELSEVEIIEQTHYPLALFATVTDILSFKAIYNAQRLSQSAIARLMHHLRTALEKMIAAPEQSFEDISILSAAEQQQIISFGQGPKIGLQGANCVQDAIAQKAEQTPDATAVIFEEKALSYQQLDRQANQLAHYLLQLLDQLPNQITSEGNRPIGLCVERSVDMMVALIAILKAGCAYVPLDPTYPAARLQHIIEDAGITHLVCHEATANVVSQIPLNRINISETAEIQAQPVSNPQHSDRDLDTLAYLIYTSGSTGKPKGVPITHRSLSNLLNSMAQRLRITATDTLMAVTTLSFDIAALELFLPLTVGASLLLASSQVARDTQQLIAYLDAYGVDIMQATPATWRLLLRSGWGGQNGLRLLCGGEALDVALAKRLLNCAEEVWNVYGPTETTIWSSAIALSAASLKDGSVPIGDPIDNTQFYVLDEKQQMVPVGIAGELYIGGAGLSPGYWQRQDLTEQRFVSVRVGADADCQLLYRTGDHVRYREDGTLDYLGRLDYQAKLRGYRVELGAIERTLMSHSKINQAVVVIRGESDNQQLVAYVTLAGEAVDEDSREASDKANSRGAGVQMLRQAWRSHLTQQLPHYMVPTVYQVLESFSLTPNGKIDRNALPAPTQPTLTPSSRPETAIEQTLMTIWQSLLPAQTISIHDNFFEIGGHSLLVISAQDKIRQQLAVELSLVDLFQYPTLRSLALHIDQIKQQGQGVPAAQSSRADDLAAGKQRLKQRLDRRKRQGALSASSSQSPPHHASQHTSQSQKEEAK